MAEKETEFESSITDEDMDWLINSTEEDWAPLAKLVAENDDSGLVQAPEFPGYPRMDSQKQGSWSVITRGSDNIAIAWTDWETASGVVGYDQNEFVDDLNAYLRSAAHMNVPAGIAYTSLLTYITDTAPSGVKLSESTSGVLANVIYTVTGATDQLIETPEIDDDAE